MKTTIRYYSIIFSCLFFISSFAQQSPSEPTKTVLEQAQPEIPSKKPLEPIPTPLSLSALEQQAEIVKTINNTLTLKHTTLYRIEGTYLPTALTNLQAPVGSPIQIKNPLVTALTMYNIPKKITFQGDFYTELHFSNDQQYPLQVTLFIENLTNPTDFNEQAQLWINTTIPEFVYKVKFSGGVTLTIDQKVLEDFLRTLLQKVVVKWRQLITVFKVEINEQKKAIASIKASSADQEKVQLIVNKLDAVFTQLIPF